MVEYRLLHYGNFSQNFCFQLIPFCHHFEVYIKNCFQEWTLDSQRLSNNNPRNKLETQKTLLGFYSSNHIEDSHAQTEPSMVHAFPLEFYRPSVLLKEAKELRERISQLWTWDSNMQILWNSSEDAHKTNLFLNFHWILVLYLWVMHILYYIILQLFNQTETFKKYFPHTFIVP